MSSNTVVFGESNSTVAVPHSYLGMPNWWQVPPSGLYIRPLEGATNNWECFENPDFTGKRYIASLAEDGSMVFQDTLASKYTGNG